MTARGSTSAHGVLLAIDTATTQVVAALGLPNGDLRAASAWAAGYRHGETLLPAIGALLEEHGIDRATIGAIIVGTGPGAFTGLRVGIATAKGLARALGCPIVGVPTGEALLSAAASASGAGDAHGGVVPIDRLVLLLPAGPSDRVVVRVGATPELLAGGSEPDLARDEVVVAVDLPDRAAPDALVRGAAARDRLAAELVRLGSERLAAQGGDDLARLVPEYVTLPRGVRASGGEVSWSRGPR